MQLLVIFSVIIGITNAIPGWGPVPGVGYRPLECIHGVPSGSTVSQQNDGSVLVEHDSFEDGFKIIPKCTTLVDAQDNSGWSVFGYTGMLIGGQFTSFNGSWTVPKAPATGGDGQINYIFTGLEDSATAGILQPVLQWGATPAGGGNYWGLSSWWVTGNGGSVFLYSELIEVNAGDKITGLMTEIYNGTWSIVGIDGSQYTTLNVKDIPPQVNAYVTLETYGIKSCSDYPGSSLVFTDLAMKATDEFFEGWTPNVNYYDCSQDIVCTGISTCTITYS